MEKNSRLVILGGGFISNAVKNFFIKKKKSVILIQKKKIDLSKFTEVRKLIKIIKKNDTIFFSAARAPVKNKVMFDYNLKIVNNFLKIIPKIIFKKMVYLSSDAVYSDTKKKINENSKTIPNSLHGMMHLKRENIFKKIIKEKKNLLIIRPTLVYGPSDPHNGYGPNKFIREAKKNGIISLFGKGEEKRDHIYINDLVKIIFKLVTSNTHGIFNLCTGKVVTFNNIAKKIKKSFAKKILYNFIPRRLPMPHKGYRSFDINKLKKNIIELKFVKFDHKFISKIKKEY